MELNINNLVLDDNSFEVLPDGDYHFTVESHEKGYASSDKLPPNTQQIICHLTIPYMKDGVISTAKVRNTLNVYSKALFAIRQFVECIGMVGEKGKASVDLEKIDGLSGICALTTISGKDGNEYNRVQIFYTPSKAPAVTANDEAWNNRNGFIDIGDDDDPIFN